MSRLIRAVLPCILVLVAAAPAAVRADALEPLERDWLQRLTERRPELAIRVGRRAPAERLLPMTDVTLAEDARWLATFAGRLRGVSVDALPAPRRADRDALLAWAEREQAAAAPGGLWHRDPRPHLERIARAIDEPLTWRGSPCRRTRWVTRRMQTVPDLLRAMQVALDAFDRATADSAATRLEGMISEWRGPLAMRAGECRDGPRFADFVEADTLAHRAAQGVLAWLRDPESSRPGAAAFTGGPVDSLPALSDLRP